MKKFNPNYNGSKNSNGTYQTIINLIPQHDLYIEGFLGSGAIMRRKKLAKFSFGFDLNQSCIDNFNIWIQSLNANLRYTPVSAIVVEKRDAISFLSNFNLMSIVLEKYDITCMVYLDPPYLMNTRISQKKLYKNELELPDHVALLNVAQASNFNIMISSYSNALYDEKLQAWHKHKYMSMTHTGLRDECLYMNYPKPNKLHDYSYIGQNSRMREKKTRAKSNMLNKFKRMSEIDRNSIIEILLSSFKF